MLRHVPRTRPFFRSCVSRVQVPPYPVPAEATYRRHTGTGPLSERTYAGIVLTGVPRTRPLFCSCVSRVQVSLYPVPTGAAYRRRTGTAVAYRLHDKLCRSCVGPVPGQVLCPCHVRTYAGFVSPVCRTPYAALLQFLSCVSRVQVPPYPVSTGATYHSHLSHPYA